MSDLRDAAAVLGSLKAAYDLSKAFLDVRGTVQQQGKVFELQSVILAAQQSALSAQEAQSTLSTRISELENVLLSLKHGALIKSATNLPNSPKEFPLMR
jgi:hypothetical protein